MLARNGSDEAQSQLVGTIGRKWADEQAVRQLSLSLALMDNPSNDTARWLMEQLDRSRSDEPSYAVLLSSLAGVGYHSSNAEIKDRIRDRIYAEIDQADSGVTRKDAYTTIPLIEAVGTNFRAAGLVHNKRRTIIPNFEV